MAGPKEVSFTVRAKDAASAVLKGVENAGTKLRDSLFSLKGIVAELTGVFAGLTIGTIVKDLLDLGVASDKAFRQIAASLPTGSEGIGKLKGEITELALSTGRARDELRSAAVEIARLGVSDPDEVMKRLAAATTLADATGAELSGTIRGLDQVMDAFGLSAGEAKETLATLFAAAKGRTDIESVFDAFQKATPVFQKFNIEADEGARILVGLLDRGHSAKQIGSDLEEASKRGTVGLRELAGSATDAGKALAELNKSAATTEAGADRAFSRLHDAAKAKLDSLASTITDFLKGPANALAAWLNQPRAGAGLTTFMNLLGFPGGADAIAAIIGRGAGAPPKVTTVPTAPASAYPKPPKEVIDGTEQLAEALAAMNEQIKTGSALLKANEDAWGRVLDKLMGVKDAFDEKISKAIEKTSVKIIENTKQLELFAALAKTLNDARDRGEIEPADLNAITEEQRRKAKERTQEIREQARAIREAVDGTIALAEAFGDVNKNLTRTLRAIGEIAASIPTLKDVLKRNTTFTLDEATGNTVGHLGFNSEVVGAMLPVASAAITLTNAFNRLTGATQDMEAKFGAAFATWASLDQRLRGLSGIQQSPIDQAHADFQKLRDEIESTLAGKTLERARNEALARVNAAEAERVKMLTAEAGALQAAAAVEAKRAYDEQQYTAEERRERVRAQILITQGYEDEGNALLRLIDRQRQLRDEQDEGMRALLEEWFRLQDEIDNAKRIAEADLTAHTNTGVRTRTPEDVPVGEESVPTGALSVPLGIDTYNKATIGSLTSISAGQASGIMGVLTTSLDYQSYLPQIAADIRTIAGFGGLSSGGAVTVGGNIYVQLPAAEARAVIDASPTIQAAQDRANGRQLIRARASAGAPRS